MNGEMWMAIVEDQLVEVKWSNRNNSYYSALGYKDFKNGESLTVKITDLPKSSRSIVKVICDHCKEVHDASYNRKSNSKNHFFSKKCSDLFKIGKPSRNSNPNTVKCSNCQKNIKRNNSQLARNQNSYCSKTCSNKHRSTLTLGKIKVFRCVVECKCCSKTLLRTKTELQRGKEIFCDKECISKYYKGKSNLNLKKRTLVECYICKKEIERIPSRLKNQDRHFCSQTCRKVWMGTDEYSILLNRGGLKEIHCDRCDKPFFKKTCIIGENNFCSRECSKEFLVSVLLKSNQSRLKEKIEVRCYNCNSSKRVNESVFKKNKYFFCSSKCYHEKRISITDRSLMTSIHMTINEILKELNVTFNNEHQVGYYSLDIYLPKHNLAIEVMGDYWHSNPIKYPDYSMISHQRIKDINKDSRKHKFVTGFKGIPILYLWETDIKNNPEMCRGLIEEYCVNQGEIQDYHSFNYNFVKSGISIHENLIKPYFIQ